VGNEVCIPVNGVTVTTKVAEKEAAVVEWKTVIKNSSPDKKSAVLKITMTDGEGNVSDDAVHVTVFPHTTCEVFQSLTVKNPKLWSPEEPQLYDCKVKILDGEAEKDTDNVLDKETLTFGIRMVTLDACYGLRINGQQIKLRGTCIHHDNGILGAATYPVAERRKCRLLKRAGFNAIRSAHHPASKALLDACDEVGLLVMDELTDMWTIHKNERDFASNFINEWKEIADAMIVKDYNHPSVILYSMGNEIQEIGTERGAERNRILSNYFKKKDSTRYTTNGVNALNAAGIKMYAIMQELAPLLQADAAEAGTNDNSGSNAINSAMKLMEGKAGEAFAVHPIITQILQESSEAMDVIGLNYLTGRHLLETKLHPNKCVLGTETFPADIARLWSVVMQSNQVLGDFTWTGYDYLGEAGCGIFYYDGKENFGSHYPDRTAYIGDMDLIGTRRPISYLREIIYGLRKEPYIAVGRVDKSGRPCSKTPWMLKDNISSWTWHGWEGTKAEIDIYSSSEKVELFLNDNSLGTKKVNTDTFTATYEVPYQPGILKAVGRTEGKVDGEYILQTSSQETLPQVETYEDTWKEGETLTFVTISFVDKNNIQNLQTEHKVALEVKNGELLGLGSGNPSSEGNYFDVETETFDGRMMAVIRTQKEQKLEVEFIVDGKRVQ
jgi:hypothetical protein